MINRPQSLFLVGALALALLASALAASPIDNTATITFNNAAGAGQTPVTANRITEFLRLSLTGAPNATVEAGLTSVETRSFTNTVTNSGSLNDSYEVIVTRPAGNTWAARIVDFAGTSTPLVFGPGETSAAILLGEITADRTGPAAVNARDFRLEIDVVEAAVATNYDYGVQVRSVTRNLLAANVTNRITTQVSAVNLTATMTVSGDLVGGNTWAGGILTYTVVITNHGPGVARDVVFTNPIPANTTYVAGSTTLNGVAQVDGTVFALNTLTVAIGTLQPARTATITYRVTVNP